MKRIALLCLPMLLWAQAAQAYDWTSLWSTQDQRGDRLLRQGDAAAAAQTFTDPRRKAYAQLQAGDYPSAAKGFSRLDDSDAHYDRGNALVGAGDLQGALAAYDEALKRNPENHDARHNRDLVEQALKKQQNPQQGSAKNKEPQQGQNQQQGGKSQDAKNDSASKPGQGDGRDSQASSKPGEQPQDRTAAAQKADGQAPDAPQKPQSGNNQNAESQNAQQQQQSGDEAEQAKRDAANGLQQHKDAPAQAQQNEPGTFANADADTQAAAATDRKPQTEQQLAQEEWLRRIPDDPGGLLRRKFMIEHMLRQRDQQQQQDQ